MQMPQTNSMASESAMPSDRPSSPYAARPWLKHYDYWVPPRMTYPGKPLYEILATTAVETPDAQATAFLGASLTFREIKRRTDRLARAFVHPWNRQRRSRRDHAAELPAVHPRHLRHSSTRCHRRQHQSDLYRTRVADGCGRLGDQGAGDARQTGAAGVCRVRQDGLVEASSSPRSPSTLPSRQKRRE